MTVPGAPPPTDSSRQDQLRAWSAGLDVAAGLVGGGFLGWLLDRWLGHAPWWMLGLGLAGLASGGYRFIREATALNRAASARFRRDSRQTADPPEKADGPPSPRP